MASVGALESEKAEIEARLDSLKAGKAKKVTKEEREQVEKEWKRAGSMARKRVRIEKVLWDHICDNYGMDKEQLEEVREVLGLDE